MSFKIAGSARRTGGVGDAETTDLLRRLVNLLRYGRIHAADYPAARVRVVIGQEDEADNHIITDWIPWLTTRAGGDRTWWAPEVGEAVLLLSPGGELTNAVALPAIFSQASPAPADRETVQRTVYEDGTAVEYDRAAHHLTATVHPAGRVLTRIGGSSLELTDGRLLLSSNGSTLELDAAGIRLNGARIDLN